MKKERKTIPLAEIQGSIDITSICSTSCPFLATEYDGITPMAFPHPGNRCFRHGSARERQLQFQRSFCLSEEYESCLIYQEKEPPHIIEDEVVSKLNKGNALRLAIPAIIVLVLFTALIYWPVVNSSFAHESGSNLPITFNVVRTFIKEIPRTMEQPAQHVEGIQGSSNNATGAPANMPRPTSASIDTSKSSPANTAAGGFRAVTYSSN